MDEQRRAEADLGVFTAPEALWEWLEALRDGPASVVVLHGSPAFAPAEDWLRRFELFPLPTVYGFDGLLEGLAFTLALHCDIRVCGEGATLRPAGFGGRRMLRVLGQDGSIDLLRAGRLVDAPTALRLGLVSSVAPAGEGVAAARELAAVIASRGPVAVQLGKEAIWRGLEMPLGQALRYETDLTLLLQTTKDRAEGVAAFLEKRQPRFTGD